MKNKFSQSISYLALTFFFLLIGGSMFGQTPVKKTNIVKAKTQAKEATTSKYSKVGKNEAHEQSKVETDGVIKTDPIPVRRNNETTDTELKKENKKTDTK